MASIPTVPILSLSLKASWDTHQRLPYNPQRTYPKLPQNPNPLTSSKTLPITSPSFTSSSTSSYSSVSDLLNRHYQNPSPVKLDETYLGYETWLPNAPKVEKPRSVYNAASLAYIGDCIYELYARRHFLFPPLNIEEYNDRVMAVVRCETQDALLQKLLSDDYLSDEERDVLRWGKNIVAAKTRTKRRAGVAVYNRASSLETLVGYLYLTNVNRLEEIMLKLGFSSGASTQLVVGETNSVRNVGTTSALEGFADAQRGLNTS